MGLSRRFGPAMFLPASVSLWLYCSVRVGCRLDGGQKLGPFRSPMARSGTRAVAPTVPQGKPKSRNTCHGAALPGQRENAQADGRAFSGFPRQCRERPWGSASRGRRPGPLDAGRQGAQGRGDIPVVSWRDSALLGLAWRHRPPCPGTRAACRGAIHRGRAFPDA
jgi:hypothetical protein